MHTNVSAEGPCIGPLASASWVLRTQIKPIKTEMMVCGRDGSWFLSKLFRGVGFAHLPPKPKTNYKSIVIHVALSHVHVIPSSKVPLPWLWRTQRSVLRVVVANIYLLTYIVRSAVTPWVTVVALDFLQHFCASDTGLCFGGTISSICVQGHALSTLSVWLLEKSSLKNGLSEGAVPIEQFYTETPRYNNIALQY